MMGKVIIRVSKKTYLIFGIIFGLLPLSIIISAYSDGNLKRDLPFIVLTFSIWLISYFLLSIYKITYDNKQITYKGLFGTKSVKINDIKDYKIKTEIATFTKSIFGLFKITINDPLKPMIALHIDTLRKKSELIIPVKLFSVEDLNKIFEIIEKNRNKRV